jgi:hypothetical protein
VASWASKRAISSASRKSKRRAHWSCPSQARKSPSGTFSSWMVAPRSRDPRSASAGGEHSCRVQLSPDRSGQLNRHTSSAPQNENGMPSR